MPIIVNFLQGNSFLWGSLIWISSSYGLWRLYRKYYPEKYSFDLSVIGLFLVLFLHRILYVIIFSNSYSSNYWSWNPIAWIGGEKLFLGTKPWVFLSFWYGGFDLRLVSICFIFVLFLISFFQKISFNEIINKILKMFYLIVPLVLLSLYFQNTLIGDTTKSFLSVRFLSIDGLRHPVQIYLFILWFLVISFVKVLVKKLPTVEKIEGLSYFCLLSTFSPLILKLFAYNIPEFVINWLIIISIFLLIFCVWTLVYDRFSKKNAQDINSRTSRFSSINNHILNNRKKQWTRKK